MHERLYLLVQFDQSEFANGANLKAAHQPVITASCIPSHSTVFSNSRMLSYNPLDESMTSFTPFLETSELLQVIGSINFVSLRIAFLNKVFANRSIARGLPLTLFHIDSIVSWINSG